MMSTWEYTILCCVCRMWHRTTLYVMIVLAIVLYVYWMAHHTMDAKQTIDSKHPEKQPQTSSANVACTLYDPAKLHQTLTSFANVSSSDTRMSTSSDRHRTEAMCRSLLESMLQMKLPKCRPKWLMNPTTRRALELDMYNSDNRIAFEYDGAQHNVYVPHYHHNEHHFAYRKLLDRLKTELCREAGVLLIRIPWKDVSVNDEVRSAKFLESLLYRNGLAYQSITAPQ